MIKRLLARVPGAIESYKIGKNLRYGVRSHLRTTGGIRGGAMDHDAAVAYVRRIFHKVDELVSSGGGWTGKRVLECGPGDSLGVGFLALAHGAASYCAIDRFPVAFDLSSERRVFASLRDGLTAEERARVDAAIELGDGGYRAKDDRLAYHNSISLEEAARRFAGEGFDVIFSNAVLEHVGDLESSLRSMRELLAPSGVMLHDVDLRSHQRFEKHPLQFLEYSPFLWRAMTSNTGEPNRCRLPAYRAILERLGFEDVRFRVTQRFDASLVEEVRPRLAEPFRGIDPKDLEVAIFIVTARAPAR